MALRSRHIVFVHGMAGWGPQDLGGKFPYWGDALAQFGPEFTAHEGKCGPVSSLHDRACEVFAQIQGTRVDYGETHSLEAGHARFSRDYSGLGFLPDWSAENPVILVGHSAGAPTCLLLQRLLADDFWGLGSSADWVEVLVSVAGALNGSIFAYRFCDEASGRMTGLPSAFIARGLDLMARVLKLGKPPLFDLYLDQWIGKADPPGDLKKLDASRFVASEDNLVYDMSLQGARKAVDSARGGCVTYPGTYYFSFVTRATKPAGWFGLPIGPRSEKPDFSMGVRQRYGGRYLTTRPEFAAPPIEGWGEGELTMAHWRPNDGLVSSISQRYPFLAGAHPVGGEGIFGRAEGFARGKWYFQNLDTALGRKFDHLDPVHGVRHKPWRRLREAHRRLYRELKRLLAGL